MAGYDVPQNIVDEIVLKNRLAREAGVELSSPSLTQRAKDKGLNGDTGSLTMEPLTAPTTAKEPAKTSSQKTENQDLYIEPLFKPAKGGTTLFDYLDTINNKDDDDKVSKNDLKKFLELYENNSRPEERESVFSAKNAAFVRMLLDNWDGEAIKELRGVEGKSNWQKVMNGTAVIGGLVTIGIGLRNDSRRTALSGASITSWGIRGLLDTETSSTLKLERLNKLSEKA
ncbi:MAG TPA: hypothetical protein V6D17_05785 [Candidatus Obscuribacterales bacterium]